MHSKKKEKLVTLDTSGLLCPYPLSKTKKKLNQLKSGELLRVVATDPTSEVDFKVFSELSGHALLKKDKKSNKYIFVFQKK